MRSSDIMLSMSKKKKKQKNPGQVIIPVNHPNPPDENEINAAEVLARHYKCVVEFLIPSDDYLRKTADIVMFGSEWELKCPIKDSKSTIQNLFRRATKQSGQIIVDSRRTKLKYEVLENRVRFEVKKRPYIKKVILIDKFENIIAIKE